jgi:uncharacterized RDD family membrane protein YckC
MGNGNYASFVTRLIAVVIDAVILGIVTGIMNAIFAQWLSTILGIVIGFAYYTYSESSANQATIGKMIMKIKVVGEDGGRVSFATAAIRYLGRIVSFVILLIGYLMVLWDPKRQALHDKIAHTYVVHQ